jgi:hypothetical protein
MSLLVITVISLLALFLVVASSAYFGITFSRFRKSLENISIKNQANELVSSDLQLNANKLLVQYNDTVKHIDSLALESIQVSKQLEHRVKILQQQVNEQQQLIASWQENQGQDKFYHRAFKLAEKGADIDEIISECELPRAEVEILLSVYHQRNHA